MLQGLLEAHESVAGHTLADLPSCSNSMAAAELPTLLLIDTAGCNFDEQQEEDGDSRCVLVNYAEFVHTLVQPCRAVLQEQLWPLWRVCKP